MSAISLPNYTVEELEKRQKEKEELRSRISQWEKDYNEAVKKNDEKTKEKILNHIRSNCIHYSKDECNNVDYIRNTCKNVNQDFDCLVCRFFHLLTSYGFK